MGVFSKISNGLAKSRDKFKDSMYDLIGRGPNLDEEFWEGLEETLILSDIGGETTLKIVDNLRSESKRLNLPDSYAVLDLLSDQIVNAFAKSDQEIFGPERQVILFVGINGTGKTTTVGKIAKVETDAGRKVILGSADTFRAAAIEQLSVWAERANVEMVTRERGSDPASVCYETIDRADEIGADLVLIDTAGRLHTSDDLMRELVKVVNVTRKRASQSDMRVFTVLVIDATTGQNGMQQAREFDKSLDLDALIITKLDGTAKGGIALAISSELELPIIKIGVGEAIDDLRDFDASQYVAALIGDFEEEDIVEDDNIVEIEEATGDHVPVEAEIASESAPQNVDTTSISTPPQTVVTKLIEEADVDSVPVSDEDKKVDSGSASEESNKMSWDEFVAFDDERKANEGKKKHFWEKW